MTRVVAIAGPAVGLFLLWSAPSYAQCATFIAGANCTPARDLGGLASFIADSELQAPPRRNAPALPEVAALTQPSPEPADCRMPIITAPDVDQRFVRTPAPEVHYAIRSKEAPACPSRGLTRRFDREVIPGVLRGLVPSTQLPQVPVPKPD